MLDYLRSRIRNTGLNYVGPALDVGVTPVRRVPVKDDGMPETPELETINLRALLRSSVLFQLEYIGDSTGCLAINY